MEETNTLRKLSCVSVQFREHIGLFYVYSSFFYVYTRLFLISKKKSHVRACNFFFSGIHIYMFESSHSHMNESSYALFFCESLFFMKQVHETWMLTKETCMYTKETCIQTKETCTLAKETYIFTKQTYILT